MHVCGIFKKKKNGVSDLIYKAGIENKSMDTKAEGGMGELGDWDRHIYTLDSTYKIDN